MGRFIFLLAVATVFAQQPAPAPSPSDPVIRVNVRQVLVPVIVTDRKGHHVGGLHASDFHIQEDGVPQDVASFSTSATASVDDITVLDKPSSETAQPSTAATPRRTYVICLDTLHSSPAATARVREALENFFHEEKGTAVQYVVVGIGRQLQVLQTATTSPLAVLQKIRGTAFQAIMGGPDAAALSAQINGLNNRMEEFCRRCACGVRSNQRTCDPEIDTLKQSIDSQAAQWSELFQAMTAQFKSVVAELAKLPTGRTLMLVSGGFDPNPRRDFYSAVAAWLPSSPQFRLPSSKDLDPTLQEALKIAAERNVAIYGIDSRGAAVAGLSSSGSMDASSGGGGRAGQSVIRPTRTTPLESPGQSTTTASAPASAVMEQLSSSTGGVYFHDSKDLLKQLRTATADGREYYVLAYVPKNSATDGGFRKISVAVTGKNLEVRTKAGYWAGPSVQ